MHNAIFSTYYAFYRSILRDVLFQWIKMIDCYLVMDESCYIRRPYPDTSSWCGFVDPPEKVKETIPWPGSLGA